MKQKKEYTLQKASSSLFIAYLWGIETENELYTKELKDLFIAYLWGIETIKILIVFKHKSLLFIAYLWGIETRINLIICVHEQLRLSRTYEELKLSQKISPFLS